MARYIDADALKPDYIVGSTSTNTECYRYVSLKQIENAPTVDAVERKRGKWEGVTMGRWVYAKCSVCGTVHDVRSSFCPNCGAEMCE